jgi:hypothetical protein
MRAAFGRVRHAVERFGQIIGRLGAARHLDQADGKFIWHVHSGSFDAEKDAAGASLQKCLIAFY